MAPRPFSFTADTFSPWFAGIVEACAELGLPLLEDVNSPADAVGIGTGPFNVTDGVRWNASFAYLDPARSRTNLTIHAGSLVDRVLFEGRRAVGAVAGGDGLRASTVVLAAGACGPPAVLLRSGIGPEADLNALGIDVIEAVDAVGANLADHVTAKLAFEPTEELQEETRRRAPVEFSNGLIKARTESCEQGFDLHLLPITHRLGESAHLTVALMDPESRGRVQLRSADPAVSPEIDHRLLSAPADRETLRAGLQVAHRLAATAALQ